MSQNVIEYSIKENDRLTIVQNFCNKTFDKQNILLRFVLERNAQLNYSLLLANTNKSITIDCILQGEGAQAQINGAYFLNTTNNVTIKTTQHHKVAHAKSNVVMKGVLKDNAYVSYHGTIRVDQNAHGTVSSQQNKNIVLSDTAHALSVPSLEVLNNDVQCFHGSAIGRFNEDQLLYAQSRGITAKQAHKLLLRAFFAHLFEDEKMKRQLDVIVDEQFI